MTVGDRPGEEFTHAVHAIGRPRRPGTDAAFVCTSSRWDSAPPELWQS